LAGVCGFVGRGRRDTLTEAMDAGGQDSGAVNPYAPPVADIEAAAPPPPAVGVYTFKSTIAQAKLIAALMTIDALKELVSGVFAVMTISVMRHAAAWEDVDRVALGAIDHRAILLRQFSFVLVIPIIVSFCAFVVRSSRNAHAFGAPMSATPGWAAGWFFVPVAWWWKPYYVMKEIWRGSDPDPAVNPASAPASALLGWWWWMWLLRNFSWQIYAQLNKRIQEPFDLTASSLLHLVFLVPSIAAALLAAAVALALARRQARRAFPKSAGPAMAVG